MPTETCPACEPADAAWLRTALRGEPGSCRATYQCATEGCTETAVLTIH